MKVLAIAGDPGGGRALLPVLQSLFQDPGVTVKVLAYRQSFEIFTENAISCEQPDPQVSATRVLQDAGATVLLAGTSCNEENHEQSFLQAAAKLGVPSISLLDFWSNYAERFRRADEKLLFPDVVAVMDEVAAAEMLRAGCPQSAVEITGHPGLDVVWAEASAQSNFEGNISGDYLAFVSQPLAALYQQLQGDSRYLGFHELDAFAVMHAAVRELLPETMIKVFLHPRDIKADWEVYLREFDGVSLAGKDEGRSALAHARAVVGMNSMLLLECVIRGCDVISLQPNLCKDDALPTNHEGLSLLATDAGQFSKTLRDVIADGPLVQSARQRRNEWRMEPGATARVIALVHRVASGDTSALKLQT